MKTKTLIPILSLAVAAAAVLPAMAAHDVRPRERVAPSTRRADVAVIAHKIEKQSRKVHRLAERYSHHRSFLENKALERLHILEDEARRFHGRVENARVPRRVVERDFHKLLRAFYRAEDGLHWMHAYDVVDREFDRLAVFVEDLEQAYDGRALGWNSRRWRRFGSLTSPAWGPRPLFRWKRG